MEVADVAVGLRAPAPSHQQLKKGSCVSEGDYVAILVNEGKKWMLARALKNEKVKLSKTVTISGDLLIGKSFGCFFEVDQRSKDLKPIFPSSRSELLMSDLDDINAVDGNDQIVSVTGEHNQLGQESRNPLQDTATTEPLVNFQKLVDTLGSNKDLISCSEAQKLSSEEIERMKVESSGKDIISQLTKNLETFKQKTIFSQLKYVNKKKKKYLLQFQLLRPTASVIAETCLSRGGLKVLWLRSDSLAQLLSQADIRSQGKYLLFDQSNGLLTGAVLERMVGLLPHSLPPPSLVEECGEQSESHTFGSVINLFSETFVPSPFSLKCFNFPTWLTDSMLTFFPLQLLQPLLISPPILPVSQFCFTASSSPSSSTSPPSEKELETEIDCPLSTEFSSPFKSDKSLPLSLQTKVRSVLSEGADALMIVTKNNPAQALIELFPFVAPSGRIVIFSCLLEPLIECHEILFRSDQAVAIELHETWLRDYQVLPQRTHPVLKMDANSGFILSATKTIGEGIHLQSFSEPLRKKQKV